MADNIKTVGGSQRMATYQTNLSGLYNNAQNKAYKYGNRASDWGVVSGVGNGLVTIGSGVATAGAGIVGGVIAALGGLTSAIGSIFSGSSEKKQAKYTRQANAFNYLQESLDYYDQALQDRDTLIFSAVNDMKDSISSMEGAYGKGFTGTLLDLYYNTNGVNDSVSDLIRGNYQTYNDIGSGQIADFYGVNEYYGLSTLTDDERNYFNANLQLIDKDQMAGSIADKLVAQLYNGKTALSEQFRANADELREVLKDQLIYERQLVEDYTLQSQNQRLSNLSEDIQGELSIGKAQASRGTSGLRGGTVSNNELIANLQKDISNAQQKVATAYLIQQFKQKIENEQRTVAKDVASMRSSERIEKMRILEQSRQGLNNMISGANKTGFEVNRKLDEAKSIRDINIKSASEGVYQALS